MKYPITPLYELNPDNTARCLACAHKCTIFPGHKGICRQRSYDGLNFQIPWEETSGLSIDPMEKKPLFHFLPGQPVLSFGLLGCNFSCPFCQNWQISQVGKDPAANGTMRQQKTSDITYIAMQNSVKAIASTYNEPFISVEWAAHIFSIAHHNNIKTVFVTNGFASHESFNFIADLLDAVNIDLKCFSEQHYKMLGGRLQPVLDNIRACHQRGIWTELTTLIVPGFNDSPAELKQLADFIASVSPDIPWHISAYFSTYHMPPTPPATPPESITRAAEIGKQAGLNFIYTGNIRGTNSQENTICPNCGNLLIRRNGFTIRSNNIADGHCPKCMATIPGVFI